MTDDLAGFAARQPERFRHAVMSALRQTCEAGVRYGYMTRNPAKLRPNPQTPPRGVRVFTPKELQSVAKELDARGSAAIRFAAATGLRPSEWAAVERRDVDRTRRVLTVRGTKTHRSRREVPSCELPKAGLGASDRERGRSYSGAAVRPTVDVRLDRARCRDHGVRARPDHGDERGDDRAVLRCPDRHRKGLTSRSPRGVWGTRGARRRSGGGVTWGYA
jgi:integrase